MAFFTHIYKGGKMSTNRNYAFIMHQNIQSEINGTPYRKKSTKNENVYFMHANKVAIRKPMQPKIKPTLNMKWWWKT